MIQSEAVDPGPSVGWSSVLQSERARASDRASKRARERERERSRIARFRGRSVDRKVSGRKSASSLPAGCFRLNAAKALSHGCFNEPSKNGRTDPIGLSVSRPTPPGTCKLTLETLPRGSLCSLVAHRAKFVFTRK